MKIAIDHSVRQKFPGPAHAGTQDQRRLVADPTVDDSGFQERAGQGRAAFNHQAEKTLRRGLPHQIRRIHASVHLAAKYDFASVGKPFPRVRIELAADGEILAKGDNVFPGYYKDEAATAAMFDARGWLKTGDLGRFNKRGFLQIIGRKKEILVTAGGKNVPPQNIELRFRNDTLISQIVVYGDGKKYLTALVDINEQAAGAHLTEAEMANPQSIRRHALIHRLVGERIDAVNQDLASFETIKAFAIADAPLTPESGLLTPSLKVKRAKVYERYKETLDALYMIELSG